MRPEGLIQCKIHRQESNPRHSGLLKGNAPPCVPSNVGSHYVDIRALTCLATAGDLCEK